MIITREDISRYRQMQNTPAGAILQHMLHRLGMSQKHLSELTGIRPQHINGLIKGSRRFSPESSLAIEAALNIEPDGLLYACQCNYDVTQAKMAMQKRPDIARLRKSTFWDVDLDRVDWQKGKYWAIKRVLQYGCVSDYVEISRLYGRQSFVDEIEKGKILLDPGARNNALSFGLL